MITPAEQETLLALARAGLEGGPGKADISPSLQRLCGAFVTLHCGGTLRGCIGSLSPEPLATLVADLARSAATQDPRFPPVTSAEVGTLHIEISVLGEPRPIRRVAQIEVGRHGLLVGRGASQGLLLPQVATKQGWDAETFLSHTCLKAGLPEDSWRKWDADFSVEVFTAQVFGEKTAG